MARRSGFRAAQIFPLQYIFNGGDRELKPEDFGQRDRPDRLRWGEVEIKADERLDIGVHGLAANDTESDAVVVEEGEELVQEVGFSTVMAFQNESAFTMIAV